MMNWWWTDDEMKGLEQLGTIKPKCWIGFWWDGISLNRLTTRSPYGDKNGFLGNLLWTSLHFQDRSLVHNNAASRLFLAYETWAHDEHLCLFQGMCPIWPENGVDAGQNGTTKMICNTSRWKSTWKGTHANWGHWNSTWDGTFKCKKNHQRWR